MKKRLITSSIYVIVLAGLIAMKWLVPGGWGVIGFDVLFCAISVLGSLELLRALKETGLAQKSLAIAFCSIIVPAYVIVEMTMGLGWLAAVIMAAVYALIVLIFYLTGFDGATGKSTVASLFTMLYCGVLCCVLSALNHLPENSLPAILVLFLTVMFTDAMAYITGMLFKRVLPYKLAPKTSPNKTVVGGAGGLIGGIAGAIVAYFFYYGITGLGYETVEGVEKLVSHFTVDGLLLGAFILIGFIASVAAQAGDLFESAIKRRCGIKDMGKLLPGHGGVLDRFDSMLFSGVVVLLGFILISI